MFLPSLVLFFFNRYDKILIYGFHFMIIFLIIKSRYQLIFNVRGFRTSYFLFDNKNLLVEQTRTHITHFILVLIMGKTWVQYYVTFDLLKWWHVFIFRLGATRDLTQAKFLIIYPYGTDTLMRKSLGQGQGKGCRLAALKQLHATFIH